MINFDQLTSFDDGSLFDFEFRQSRITGLINENNPWAMLIQLWASRDSTLIQRDVYSSLDFLSDIGGIQGLFVSVFGLVITMVNTEKFEEHLIGQLFAYRVKPKRANM